MNTLPNASIYGVFVFSSYALMISCWHESSSDRPLFSELVESVNVLVKPLAGYLDFADII